MRRRPSNKAKSKKTSVPLIETAEHPLFKRKINLLRELDELEYLGIPVKVAPAKTLRLLVQIADIEAKFGWVDRAAEIFQEVAKECVKLKAPDTAKKYFRKAGIQYLKVLKQLAESRPPISPLYAKDGSLSPAALSICRNAFNVFIAAGEESSAMRLRQILKGEVDPLTLKPIKK